MSNGRLAGVMRRLVDVALADGGGLSDGALLERYLNLREEAAFAALVRIHGPMVLGVCRRVLGNVHDADDAFQATFLVLVRKGQTIVPRERVGPWLYGVAYRTALKASAMAKRRRGKQVKLEDLADKDTQPETEWLALLDQEISRLPEKYRAPLVLCDLESKTRKQAAKLLGCPEGTVATRLQHARRLIQKRLTRHGLPAAAGATALALGQAASAKVPFALLKATVKHASLFAAGTSAGAIPLKIVVLMEGVLNAMVLTKIKTATALLVLAGVLGVGGFAGKVYVAADDAPLPPPLERKTQKASQAHLKESDPRLPRGPTPVQAIISGYNGKLLMRTRRTYYQPTTKLDIFGVPTTSYTPIETEARSIIDIADINMVLEVQHTGQRFLDLKEMGKAIRGETLALVVEGKGDFDLAHLRLIKEGTLVFVLAHRELIVPPIPKAPTTAQGVPIEPPPVLPVIPPTVEPGPPLIPANVVAPPPVQVQIADMPRENNQLRDAEFTIADLKFEMGDVPQALRRYADLQDKYRRQVAGLIACQKIWRCVSLMHDYPAQARMARADMVEALRKFKADLEGMPEESDDFRGPGVYRKKDWENWLQTVANQLNPPMPDWRQRVAKQLKPPTPPLPSPFSASPPPDNLSQFNAQTMQQANRDLAVLKFYVKTGHAGSAAFYRDLIQKRYPDSLYSQQAEQLVRDMKQPAAPEKGKVRVGQVIIVGNEHLPDAVIRQTLGFYPGAPLNYKDLRPAEERLNRVKDVGMHIAATVIVLDPDQGDFRDILVQVRELLDDTTRADMGRLQGAWTVVAASLQGNRIPALDDATFVFTDNELNATTKITKSRFSILLNPSAQLKEIRLFPIDDTPDARPARGTYELKGDALLLRVRPDKDEAPANASPPIMELKLKRKGSLEAPFGDFYPKPQAQRKMTMRIQGEPVLPKGMEKVTTYRNAEVVRMAVGDDTPVSVLRNYPPMDGFFLKCDSLKANCLKDKMSDLTAEGNVFFREQKLSGNAAVIKYNESEDQIIFEGTPSQAAILHKKQPGHTEDQEIKGAQVIYNRKTGTLQVAGGITIAN